MAGEGRLAALGVALVRAANPGPLTLSGTNTWLAGRDPVWVVDPGPALPAHLDAVAAVVHERGGAGGIALTHAHADHAEGAVALARALGGVPIAAMAFARADLRLADGDRAGPLTALAVPGHAPDHLVLRHGSVAFTGDAVLGTGSVFVASDMAAYLDGLRRLRDLAPAVLCPGHGDPVWDPRERLDRTIAHRLEREARLLEALARGIRGEAALLDAVWDDAPAVLRPAAALTLRAHLEKLRDERRLPS